ncbi:MAG: hypothetical protein JXB39_14900 [Deltaproteobacteria bacterium]|nr:hypothetical protein [Deltaproteobacteria bacterium]
MRPLIILIATSLVLGGCHCKFKKVASTLGEVRVQALVTGLPYVHLGRIAPPANPDHAPVAAVATGVVNVVQGVRETEQTARIARAVDHRAVNEALVAGIGETLGDGPPFAFSPVDQGGHVMQVEVRSWGLMVPYLGAPGEFTYDLRVRIYTVDGDRVYSSSTTCTAGVGQPDPTAVVLGVVNNVAELERMSDAQITDAFSQIAYWCGMELVRKIRQHAG